MRADRREPVAVGRPASEVAAAGVGHGGHCGFDAALDAGPFGLAEPTEERHDEVVGFGVGIDAAADLGDPQLDAVMHEQRERQRELRAGEGSLRFTDHDRAERAIPAGTVREESCRLGAARPGQRAGDTDVEVLGDDATSLRGDQARRKRALPSDAVGRGLTVFGADPRVQRRGERCAHDVLPVSPPSWRACIAAASDHACEHGRRRRVERGRMIGQLHHAAAIGLATHESDRARRHAGARWPNVTRIGPSARNANRRPEHVFVVRDAVCRCEPLHK